MYTIWPLDKTPNSELEKAPLFMFEEKRANNMWDHIPML